MSTWIRLNLTPFSAGFLNREVSAPFHRVTVTAMDGGDLETSADYDIVILNENDNTPTFQDDSFYSFTVAEDLGVRKGVWLGTIGGRFNCQIGSLSWVAS